MNKLMEKAIRPFCMESFRANIKQNKKKVYEQESHNQNDITCISIKNSFDLQFTVDLSLYIRFTFYKVKYRFELKVYAQLYIGYG